MRKWCRRSSAVPTIASTLNRKVSPAALAEYLPHIPPNTTLVHHLDDVYVDRSVSTSSGAGSSCSHGGDFVFKRVAQLDANTLDRINAHGKPLSCVLSDGDCIYTASENEICIWNRNRQAAAAAEFIPVQRIKVKSPVKCLAVSGNRIFSAHADNTVRVWKITNQKLPIAMNNDNNNYKLVATLPRMRQRVVSSLWADNYVQVRRHHKKLWLEHADVVSALAVSENRGLLYSASWDKTVKVWRLSDLKCVESITAHHDAVNALLVVNNKNNNNNNSEWLYTASADGSVKVWMRQGGQHQYKHKLLGSIEGGHAKSASVNAIAVTDRPTALLWSAGSDGTIRGWGLKKNKLSDVAEYELRAANPACGSGAILSLRADGNLLFSVGSLERAVRVWRISVNTYDYELSCVGVLGGGRGAPVRSLFVDNNDAGVLYSGGWDCPTVNVYALTREVKVKPISPIPYFPI